MKIKAVLKWVMYIILSILILANLAILISGKTYIYKALVYNYVNIDDYKIFENRLVKAGVHQPWAMAKNYNQIQISKQLLQELDSLHTTSFLIIKNDSVLYEKYGRGYTGKEISNSFSMAKTIIGILVGVALDEGKIKSLDEPVSDFIPSFKTGMKAHLTIRHLLMMSSGLNWDEAYASLFSVTTEAYYGSDLEKLIARLDVVTEPGTKHNYKGSDTQLLAFILEKATGKKVADYASEKLWQKIGAHYDALWSLDHKDGHEKAYCCFNACAKDFARFGKLYLDSGSWNGQKIVSSNYVKQSITPNMLLDENGNKTDYYGYQWWLENYKDHKIFYMRGILGQWVIVIPQKRIIIVRLGEIRGAPQGNAYKEFFDMIDEAIKL